MDGDEELRLRECEHHLLLFLAGVAGDVQIGVPVVYDLRALVEQLIDNAAYHILIAGNSGCGDDNTVARIDIYLLMLGKSHAVERGHRLALTAGGYDDGLIARQLVYLVDVHHDVLRDIHISENGSDVQDVLHAAPGYADLAVILCRDVYDLLQAVYVRSEGRDDYALVAAHEELVKALADLALRRGMTRLLNVRRVAQQREHALVAKLAEAGDVYHAAGNGRDVYLEVTGVDDRADGRRDSQCDRIGDTVVHVDELNSKAAETEDGAVLLGKDLGVIELIVLFELQLDQRRREGRSVYGNVQIAQQIGHAADMILVAVREDQPAYLLGVGFKVGDIRQDDIDTVHILIREAHACVNNDYIAAAFIGRHILAYFAQTAERDYFQF